MSGDYYTCVLVKSTKHRNNQILFIRGEDGLTSKEIFFFINENLEKLKSEDALRFWAEK